MSTSKDLKRLARSRMQKTGESYTTARAQLLKKKSRPLLGRVPEVDFSKLAGMSDDAVRAKTERTWKQWVTVLDAVDAHSMPHRDIAKHLTDAHQLPGWWAQTVTVGYERIRGLRDVGQRRGGGYEANKSRTFPVTVTKLYAAVSSAAMRRRWMPNTKLTVRKATKEKSLRITWHDGSSVDLHFTPKGEKCQLTVQHRELARKADALGMKKFWSERLEALAGVLMPQASASKGTPSRTAETRPVRVSRATAAGPRRSR